MSYVWMTEMTGPLKTMNAREGIKTKFCNYQSCILFRGLKTMNAREGIKTHHPPRRWRPCQSG